METDEMLWRWTHAFDDVEARTEPPQVKTEPPPEAAVTGRRRRRRRVEHAVPPEPLRAPGGLPRTSAPPVAFEVDDVAGLYQRYPRLRELVPPPQPAAPAATEEDHYARPYASQRFQHLLSRLPRPEFTLLPFGPAGAAVRNQELLWRAMQQTREDERLALPVQTASHESRLLAQAGTFDGVTYPACRFDRECVGRTEALRDAPPGGFVLTQLLFAEEYESLLAHGTAPEDPRPCVLCYRYYVHEYALARRTYNGRVEGLQLGVIQAYRNLADEPEGYLREEMLFPHPEGLEGFLDPLVLFRLSPLRCRRAANGRWHVDQSALLYRPTQRPPPPEGQSLGLFSRD